MKAAALALALVAGFCLRAAAEPHRAEIRLTPADGALDARVTLRPDGPVTFRLATGLAVLEAASAGQPLAVSDEGGVWRIAGPTGAPIQLRYAGRIATDPTMPPPFLGPSGGFLPAGSGWLPDLPGAFDLTLEVPQPYAAVATGRLAEEEIEAGRYRARFLPEPGGGESTAFVGVYRVETRRSGPVELRTYFDPEDAALADLYLERTGAYLQRFDREIGRYPYGSFSVVAGPLPVGLGFPGLTYVARRILPLPFMQTGSLAHEILHGWWGGAVGVDYARGNWAEGLTTYLADYALAADAGADQARAMRLAWLRDFAALPPSRDRPLVGFVAREHDAAQVVGYGKAAFLFHMLRQQVGEVAFGAALRRFYAAHRFRDASWADLRSSFEATAGRDLGRFFAQWLERPGAPRLELAAATVNGRALEIVLRQDEPTYALAVPVTVATDAGSVRREVALDGPEARARLELEATPRELAVDPDQDLFRRLAPGEAPPILRDVTLDPDTALVVATDHPQVSALARRLAARLLDREPPPVAAVPADAPALVVGLTAAVADLLAASGLPPVPPTLAGRGTARVWTAARAKAAPPLLVVAADDAPALEALSRPLPHYRRDSFLVFSGDRVVDRGSWPPGDSALHRRLDR